MLRMNTRRLIALFAAVTLVWGQLAVAAYACTQPAVAESSSMVISSAMQADDCHRSMDEQSTPLCKAHCVQPAQSHQIAAPDIPSVQLVAIFDLPRLSPDNTRSGAFSRNDLPRSPDSSPPLRIQYQVFRI